MKVGYSKSFLKDVQNLNDQSVSESLKEILIKCKKYGSLKDIPNLKKLRKHKTAYRIRIGDYRAGFYYEKRIVLR